MATTFLVLFIIVLSGFSVFTYGFTDTNLHLSSDPRFTLLHDPLFYFVNHARPATTAIFFIFLLLLFIFYLFYLRNGGLLLKKKHLIILLGASAVILACSFSAFSYDIFNYITTAKVLYTYHENPYVVMPIEIPNEPYLAFTRAANKLALYGPVWLALTSIPHHLGGGNLWRTIIAFKLMNAAAWLMFSYFIYRVTKSPKNVIFFALNPLVLIETLVSGHNDIYMIGLALLGLVLWKQNGFKDRAAGSLLMFASWWIKGATVVLTPLLFFRKLSLEKTLVAAYWLMALVFFIATPIREELYPWYAVWLIATASLLPLKRHPFLEGFTVVLSFALELRQMPYMWMAYYEGPGPLLRFLLTVIPTGIYVLFWVCKKYFRKSA